MTPAEVRLDLHHGGYMPLPLIGKRPMFEDWPKRTDVTEHRDRALVRARPRRPRTLESSPDSPRVFDIDIFSDAEAAEAVANLTRERFEEHGYFLVRTGKWPKRAIPFRTDTPFEKISVTLISPSGKAERLEVLMRRATGGRARDPPRHPAAL